MAKRGYAAMFTLRSDGRYVASYTGKDGKRHYLYDRDPKRLYDKMQEKDREPQEAQTFTQAAAAWKDEHDAEVGYKTRESYEKPYKRVTEYFGDVRLEDMTANDISAFLHLLARQGFGKRSVQLHLGIISMTYDKAIAAGSMEYNPCSVVKLPKNLHHEKRKIPSDDALEAVKNGFSVPFGLFAGICLYSGLRRGEALALRYEDIDRKRKIIHVTRAVEYVSNTPQIKTPKTEAGCREAILLDVLEKQIPRGTGYIFTENGKLLSGTQYQKKWTDYCKAIGYEITAHQLRHGFATILYEAGIADKDAQELLGHSNITLTRDVYTHIRKSRKEETAKKLNEFVGNF